MTPLFSICIPAYNRADLLPALLDTIVTQDFTDFEIVICEDASPEQAAIREVAKDYRNRYPVTLRYQENPRNLGYDGNFRALLEQARGTYCFFMGNDDLMCPGALATVASALKRYDNIGVVLRSYASFVENPQKIDQTFRYFDSERFFPSGAQSITAVYRRFVVISGLVLNRAQALRHATDRFDGTLLYQLHLVAHILADMNAVFLPEVIVLWRKGGIPDFGHSEKEKGKFTPRQKTPESSLHFMRGVLDIARYAEESTGLPIYRPILNDYANYAYPFLEVQTDKGLRVFLRYVFELTKMGFWRGKMFFVYVALILALGPRRVDRLIQVVKRQLGHTPAIGRVYRGEST